MHLRLTGLSPGDRRLVDQLVAGPERVGIEIRDLARVPQWCGVIDDIGEDAASVVMRPSPLSGRAIRSASEDRSVPAHTHGGLRQTDQAGPMGTLDAVGVGEDPGLFIVGDPQVAA